MIIIYFIIFIIIFYEIYKYISQNINYSQFEHFYNNSDREALSDLVYKTITTGLNASQNNIENFIEWFRQTYKKLPIIEIA